ncbi:helix-turn-helix domain-containing protein [Microcoleus sp. BROC3]|uniref:helix-turn-helix domain-containing protein n=1 Tax=Microcoleus sp. BROC3 TaxID=3055323 RepID=UPI004040AD90
MARIEFIAKADIIRYVTRAHCLILVSQRLKKGELMNIFQISYNTLYNWFDRWELEGMIGLYNKPGRVSKPLFYCSQKA